MHADSYFAIGKTHRICQDYATHGTTADGRPIAVVSDGCSSSPDTDFGARLVARAAVANLPQAHLPPEQFIWVAEAWQRAIQMPQVVLDATMLSLLPGSETIRVNITGDGVVAARRRDGTFEWWVIEFLPGGSGRSAPAYLSYLLDPGRYDAYTSSDYSTRRLTRFVQHPGGSAEERETYPEKIRRPEDFVCGINLLPSEYDFIAVLSDGVQSFQQKDGQGRVIAVPLPLVLAELLAIKQGSGDFIVRRCHRFLTRFCEQKGWWHHDDFSMAAIWCGES